MTCPICNGKQLIPFVKDGRTIPYAWEDCACKEVEPYHFRDTRPEDFDFAMSASFRELTFELYGRPWEQRPTFTRLEPAVPAENPPELPTGQVNKYSPLTLDSHIYCR